MTKLGFIGLGTMGSRIAEGRGWGNRDQVSAVNLYADYVGIASW